MTNENMGRPVGNKHKVPQKQWQKWSNHAKKVFNQLYESMSPRQQWMFLHPKQPAMPREHWKTTAWNAAWNAAAIANGDGRLSGVIQEGRKLTRRPKHEGKPSKLNRLARKLAARRRAA